MGLPRLPKYIPETWDRAGGQSEIILRVRALSVIFRGRTLSSIGSGGTSRAHAQRHGTPNFLISSDSDSSSMGGGGTVGIRFGYRLLTIPGGKSGVSGNTLRLRHRSPF